MMVGIKIVNAGIEWGVDVFQQAALQFLSQMLLL